MDNLKHRVPQLSKVMASNKHSSLVGQKICIHKAIEVEVTWPPQL
jgi:hypothetical protein